jgi:hypothetical protein
MALPKITNKQIEILNLIYTYRFLNRIQIQTFLNHKYHKRINDWLKDLTRKEYVRRIYSNKLGENTKSAIYYAGINAIRYYKTLDLNSTYIKKLYRDNERSESFIDEQIFIADICLDLMAITSKGQINYTFVTAAGVTSNQLYIFMEDLSPQLTFTKKNKSETKQYILTTLNSSMPKYMVKKRIKKYFELFFTNEWEEHTGQPFPTILFACETKALMIFAKHSAKYLRDDYQNPDDLELWFGMNEDIKECGIGAEIWE